MLWKHYGGCENCKALEKVVCEISSFAALDIPPVRLSTPREEDKDHEDNEEVEDNEDNEDEKDHDDEITSEDNDVHEDNEDDDDNGDTTWGPSSMKWREECPAHLTLCLSNNCIFSTRLQLIDAASTKRRRLISSLKNYSR